MRYSGSALTAQWIWSGGTLTINTDFRSCDVNPGGETHDATAGGDGSHNALKAVPAPTIDFSILAVDNAGSTDGTAYAQAFLFGNVGTVIVQPYGNTSNFLEYTLPAISLGPAHGVPYADVSEYTVSFKGNTSAGLTTGAVT